VNSVRSLTGCTASARSAATRRDRGALRVDRRGVYCLEACGDYLLGVLAAKAQLLFALG